MTLEEKLDNFYKLCMDNAREESQEELGKYRKAMEQIFEEHKEESDRKLTMALKTETVEHQQTSNMEVAREQIMLKKKISSREEELTGQLFEEVGQMLESYKKTPDYLAGLKKQIADAIDFAKGEELRLYIDASDQALLPELKRDLPANCELLVSKEEFGGGTRGVLHSMNILIDNSFAKRISELKEEFSLSHEL